METKVIYIQLDCENCVHYIQGDDKVTRGCDSWSRVYGNENSLWSIMSSRFLTCLAMWRKCSHLNSPSLSTWSDKESFSIVQSLTAYKTPPSQPAAVGLPVWSAIIKSDHFFHYSNARRRQSIEQEQRSRSRQVQQLGFLWSLKLSAMLCNNIIDCAPFPNSHQVCGVIRDPARYLWRSLGLLRA